MGIVYKLARRCDQACCEHVCHIMYLKGDRVGIAEKLTVLADEPMGYIHEEIKKNSTDIVKYQHAVRQLELAEGFLLQVDRVIEASCPEASGGRSKEAGIVAERSI